MVVGAEKFLQYWQEMKSTVALDNTSYALPKRFIPSRSGSLFLGEGLVFIFYSKEWQKVRDPKLIQGKDIANNEW